MDKLQGQLITGEDESPVLLPQGRLEGGGGREGEREGGGEGRGREGEREGGRREEGRGRRRGEGEGEEGGTLISASCL